MKKYCLSLLFISLIITYPHSVFAVNDTWLGRIYSVEMVLSNQEPFTDPPKFKTVVIMPSYPQQYMQASLPGRACVQFLVGQDGVVTNIKILNSSSDEFGIEARKAIQSWSFTPGKKRVDGKDVAVRMQCVFVFKVTDQEA